MINYNTLNVHRGIMHNIKAKEIDQTHGKVIYEDTPFEIDDTIRDIIRKRLVSAVGKDSRCFELGIKEYSAGSFFHYAKNIKNLNQDEFVQSSKNIAKLLAQSQTRTDIPDCEFIILDCTDKINDTGIYIVIKADFHEALKHTKKGGKSKLEVLHDIFLSPSQKLFKIGMLIEDVDKSKKEPNNFIGFLFDENFRVDANKPAEYFYKDFLGFSLSENDKIQTALFYEQTSKFITKNFHKPNERETLIKALKIEFTANSELTISPKEFGKKYFKGDINDLYNDEVVNDLPPTFAKNDYLIRNQLKQKKIFFPNSIRISGDFTSFDENVTILNVSELKEIKNTDTYTFLRIKGKPVKNA